MNKRDFKREFPDIKFYGLTTIHKIDRLKVEKMVLKLVEDYNTGLVYFEYDGYNVKIFTSDIMRLKLDKMVKSASVVEKGTEYTGVITSEKPFLGYNEMCVLVDFLSIESDCCTCRSIEVKESKKINRAVKFRGMDAVTGLWIYGDLLTSNGKVCEISDWYSINCYRYDVIPKTVGQYTGEQDKNGKEIYEGDIIKGPSGYKYVVLWGSIIREEQREFFIDRYNFTGWCVGYKPDKPCDLFDSEVCKGEVIGNIHENIELLNS